MVEACAGAVLTSESGSLDGCSKEEPNRPPIDVRKGLRCFGKVSGGFAISRHPTWESRGNSMGLFCRYCGQSAGLFRAFHSECQERFQKGRTNQDEILFELDDKMGKVFEVSREEFDRALQIDETSKLPPFHPGCRCVALPGR